MKRLAELTLKLKCPIILVGVALTLFFGYQLKGLKIYADVINSLPDDDTTAVLYTDIGNKCGGNTIPDEQDKIEQLWFSLDGQDVMLQLVTDDLDEGIIQSKFASAGSKDMDEFVNYM